MNFFRASELKSELERLGLPSTGSRQALENRLMDYYQSTQDDQYEQLAQQVSPWTAESNSLAAYR